MMRSKSALEWIVSLSDILGESRMVAFLSGKEAQLHLNPKRGWKAFPKFYIDTATREGMSGSPVFAFSLGSILYENGLVGQSKGVVSRFLGVYSGRVGSDALGSQLGIVWKESVLAEILSFGIQGQSSELLTQK